MDLKTSFCIANRLKSERIRAGLSHAKLSESMREKYGISISVDSLKGYEVEKESQTKTGSNMGMRIEYLYHFADFYGVSSDYLLGISDVRSKNENVQSIRNATGLSESAIERLISWKTNSLNSFLEKNASTLKPTNFIESLIEYREIYLLARIYGELQEDKKRYNNRESEYQERKEQLASTNTSKEEFFDTLYSFVRETTFKALMEFQRLLDK